MEGYMYILKCADNSYYTGSTNNLELRLQQHNEGEGANHTKKRLPVELVYLEKYPRIDQAFYREKQVQGWRREKKEALIKGEHHHLPELAVAYRDKFPVASSASATGSSTSATGSTNPATDNSTPKALPEVDPEYHRRALEGSTNEPINSEPTFSSITKTNDKKSKL